MHTFTRLIQNDMKPALGVTEPGAIAFAVSTARSYTRGEVEDVLVSLNSGMYKNAFTCGIPNSDKVGNIFSAALGVVAGNPEKGLESLEDVTDEDNEKAEELVAQGKVKVVLDHVGSEITIDAKVKTTEDECIVKISGSHTDIYYIEKNQKIIFEKERKISGDSEEAEEALIHKYTLQDFYEYLQDVNEEEIAFIGDAFAMNLQLLEEGLRSSKTTFGPLLLKINGGKYISEDARADRKSVV